MGSDRATRGLSALERAAGGDGAGGVGLGVLRDDRPAQLRGPGVRGRGGRRGLRLPRRQRRSTAGRSAD